MNQSDLIFNGLRLAAIAGTFLFGLIAFPRAVSEARWLMAGIFIALVMQIAEAFYPSLNAALTVKGHTLKPWISQIIPLLCFVRGSLAAFYPQYKKRSTAAKRR